MALKTYSYAILQDMHHELCKLSYEDSAIASFLTDLDTQFYYKNPISEKQEKWLVDLFNIYIIKKEMKYENTTTN